MMNKIVLLILVSFLVVGCSKTVKGPVSGKKYDIKVGGWSDMDKYKAARESLNQEDDERDKSDECNVVDCPDDVTTGESN